MDFFGINFDFLNVAFKYDLSRLLSFFVFPLTWCLRHMPHLLHPNLGPTEQVFWQIAESRPIVLWGALQILSLYLSDGIDVCLVSL